MEQTNTDLSIKEQGDTTVIAEKKDISIPEQTQNTQQEQDIAAQEKRTFTQEELDSIIQKRLADEKRKADQRAQMTLAEREAELARREQELRRVELRTSTMKLLEEKNIPVRLADFFDFDTEEEMRTGMDILAAAFKESVNEGVEQCYKCIGNAP